MGGRTSTSWDKGSSWNHGETKTIRVPIALEPQIMAYARAVDRISSHSGIPQREGDIFLQFTLELIDRYIIWRQRNYRSTANSRQPDITSRPWDELRKFQNLIKENPSALGDETCFLQSSEL
jgi:hypothetical protein